MPLDIQRLRELNKLSLYVTCCSDPAGRLSMGSAGVWEFSLYSEGGLGLDAGITTEDLIPGGGVGSTNIGKFLSGAAQIGWGLVPQVDYSRKFLFQGTSPLSFSSKCYLVLEDDVVSDFYDPLLRLFFLTYPQRGDEMSKSITESVSRFASDFSKDAEKHKDSFWYSLADFLLRGNSGSGGISGAVDWVSKNFNGLFGDVYSLHAPPTFRSPIVSWVTGGRKSGVGRDTRTLSNGVEVHYYPSTNSGLSVGYGRSFVSNVYIKSLGVSIPKLYYSGGFPQVMEVSLTFETLRVATSDMLFDSLSGRMTGF